MACTDAEIIAGILKGGRDAEDAIRCIYSYWTKKVSTPLLNMGLSKHLVEDFLQDGIAAFLTNLKEGQFKELGTLTGYFYKICSNLSKKSFKRKMEFDQLVKDIPEENESEPIWMEILDDKKLGEKFDMFFNNLDYICQKIFELRAEGRSHPEIAEILGLKNENACRQQYHRCKQKGRDFLGSLDEL